MNDPLPTIFIIIPVYNVGKYLRRCLDSVCAQTYKELVAVVVDDASTDDSPTICDEYARRYDFFHVIHRPVNGGLSTARNTGLDWAAEHGNHGWLSFLDSDDWLRRDCLEILLRGALEHGVDISICSFQRTDGSVDPETSSNSMFRILDPQQFLVYCDQWKVFGLYIQNIACAKLFAMHVFDGIRFPEPVKAHEDVYTIYKTLFAQKRVALTEAQLYYYFENPDSITGSKWRPERLHTLWGHQEQIDFFESNGFNTALDVAVQQQMRRYEYVIRESRAAGAAPGTMKELYSGRAELFRKYSGRIAFPLTRFPGAWRQLRPFRAKFFYLALAIEIGPKETIRRILHRVAVHLRPSPCNCDNRKSARKHK